MGYSTDSAGMGGTMATVGERIELTADQARAFLGSPAGVPVPEVSRRRRHRHRSALVPDPGPPQVSVDPGAGAGRRRGAPDQGRRSDPRLGRERRARTAHRDRRLTRAFPTTTIPISTSWTGEHPSCCTDEEVLAMRSARARHVGQQTSGREVANFDADAVRRVCKHHVRV